ncbi:MAG: FAD-binding oxidoreductase [Actinobacteria bacterium]|nr:FAD-binding oxidoreductase [Actinomycetota bacterium]MCA1719783.1 FAD-binding oxidoreductase [Actinomycetota bacterium]
MSAPDRRLLTGWGRTPATSSAVSPATDVESLFRAAGPRGAIARGLGRSYGDAAQNAGGTVVDTTSRATVRSFVDGLVTVDAGMSLDALLRAFVPLGWFVPVTPGTRFVTVGGAIGADIHGKNHHVDGSISRAVTAMTVATPTGTYACSADENADLFWATVGGMGLTGIVVEATLRMIPIQTSYLRVDTERAADLDDLMARMLSGDDAYRYSVAWIDCVTTGRSLGRSVLTRGDHAVRDDLPAKKRSAPLAYDPHMRLTAPPFVPSGLVRPETARLLNEAWFRRAPVSETAAVHTIPVFFHPLDGVGHWNRMYGRRGFVQYQFLVPDAQGEVVRTAIERLAAARCPSVLAVLKRFGPSSDGHLSFPAPGWTLALDLPVGPPALAAVLDELDDLVVEAGGRLYFAKDSRMRPELVPAMYPRLAEWRAVCERYDPEHVLQSDLDRRLGLRHPLPKELARA